MFLAILRPQLNPGHVKTLHQLGALSQSDDLTVVVNAIRSGVIFFVPQENERQNSMNTVKREGYRQTAGIVCSLAAIVSTTAMRHQQWVQHEQLTHVFCPSQDANILKPDDHKNNI
jgi:DNA-binding winged helix-turn-helix (wHTH) protein